MVASPSLLVKPETNGLETNSKVDIQPHMRTATKTTSRMQNLLGAYFCILTAAWSGYYLSAMSDAAHGDYMYLKHVALKFSIGYVVLYQQPVGM